MLLNISLQISLGSPRAPGSVVLGLRNPGMLCAHDPQALTVRMVVSKVRRSHGWAGGQAGLGFMLWTSCFGKSHNFLDPQFPTCKVERIAVPTPQGARN